MSVLELNRIINQYDPPKDLHVGGRLNLRNHRADVTKMLHGLFGVPKSKEWLPIGGKKDMIKDALDAPDSEVKGWDKRGRRVVRIKHSSGHNSRPEKLFLAQDNGPIDIVSNPRVILTPASVLDSAGKTKKSTARYTVTNLIAQYPLLSNIYLRNVGMGRIITGDITMSTVGNNYNVKIPVLLESERSTIQEKFNRETFVVQGKLSYFSGNNVKNAAIARMIYRGERNRFIEGQKYILCKELGDTLQVLWLNSIFDKPGVTGITKGNTVIGTTDEVVLWRCIVNKVGVIHTNSLGESRHYSPMNLSPEEREQVNRALVETTKIELLSHNMSVISLLEEICNNGESSGAARTDWIEPITWSVTTINNAVKYLRGIISLLKEINNKLNATFASNGPANVEAAKKLAIDYKFINPFVKTKTHYKRIQTTKSLLPYNKEIFLAKNVLPTSFGEGTDPDTYIRPPLVEDLIGGGFLEGLRVLDIPSQLKFIRELRKDLIKNIQPLAEDGIDINDTIIVDKVANRLQKEDQSTERIDSILNANLDSEKDLCFLFFFIREFFSELFTYADFMKSACLLNGLNLTDNNGIVFNDLRTEYLLEKYDVNPYTYSKNDKISIGWERMVFSLFEEPYYNFVAPSSTQREIVSNATQEMIFYAFLFLNLFPDFKTEQLENFITRLENRYKVRFIVEGFEEELDKAASVAIGLYEFHYSLEQKASYKNIDINELVLERIVNIFDINTLLSNETNDILKMQLDYFIEELKSLPTYEKYEPKLQEIFKTEVESELVGPPKIIRTRNITYKSRTPSPNEARAKESAKPPVYSWRTLKASQPLGTTSRTPSPDETRAKESTKLPVYSSRSSTSSNSSGKSKLPPTIERTPRKQQSLKRGWMSPTTLSPTSSKPSTTKKYVTNSVIRRKINFLNPQESINNSQSTLKIPSSGGRRTRRKNKTRR